MGKLKPTSLLLVILLLILGLAGNGCSGKKQELSTGSAAGYSPAQQRKIVKAAPPDYLPKPVVKSQPVKEPELGPESSKATKGGNDIYSQINFRINSRMETREVSRASYQKKNRITPRLNPEVSARLNATADSSLVNTPEQEKPARLRSIPIAIYVSVKTGNNRQSGTSSYTPFKTISRALSEAQAGDSIYVAEGIYNWASGEIFGLKLKEGVSLLGGYSLDFSENDAARFQTVIDAQDHYPALIYPDSFQMPEIRGFIVIQSTR